ncbi:MAG TPA: hypothetical protein VGL93_12450 [Streptosporangiaceae bacterium]|jgi:hypothetical protein
MSSATAAGTPTAPDSGSLAKRLIKELARTSADLPRPELRKASDRVADALAVLRTVGTGDDQVEAAIRELVEVRDRLRTATADLTSVTDGLERYALYAVGMPLPGYPDGDRSTG